MTDLYTAKQAVKEVWLSAGDAEGNATEAMSLIEHGDLDGCLQRLGWLRDNAGTAFIRAGEAIEKVASARAQQGDTHGR